MRILLNPNRIISTRFGANCYKAPCVYARMFMTSHFKRKVRDAWFILKPVCQAMWWFCSFKKRRITGRLFSDRIYRLQVVFLRPKGFIRNPSLDNANTGLLQYYTKVAYRGDDGFSAASTWSDYWNWMNKSWKWSLPLSTHSPLILGGARQLRRKDMFHFYVQPMPQLS